MEFSESASLMASFKLAPIPLPNWRKYGYFDTNLAVTKWTCIGDISPIILTPERKFSGWTNLTVSAKFVWPIDVNINENIRTLSQNLEICRAATGDHQMAISTLSPVRVHFELRLHYCVHCTTGLTLNHFTLHETRAATRSCRTRKRHFIFVRQVPSSWRRRGSSGRAARGRCCCLCCRCC